MVQFMKIYDLSLAIIVSFLKQLEFVDVDIDNLMLVRKIILYTCPSASLTTAPTIGMGQILELYEMGIVTLK